MDDLIWRSLQGNADRDDERALARWRAASPSNEQRYQELVALWDASAAVSPPRPETRRPVTAEILRDAGLRDRSPDGWRRGVGRRWLVPAAVAAASIALMFGVLRHVRTPLPEQVQEVVTGQGETASVRLADGSLVRLGPGSLLRLPQGPRTRDVWLEGKAFFATATAGQDGSRFTVRSTGGQATPIGTRFEMQTQEDEFRVVVVEGRVAVEARGGKAEGGAGEVIYVVDNTAPAVARVENPRALLDWMHGVLVFQDTPLRRVAEEIEAEYGVQIVVADSVLAGRVVTAFFMDQPVEAVVTVVCQVIDASCSLGADRVTMELPFR